MILGIDPGLTGALALFQPSVAAIHEILDMPVNVLRRGKGNRREIDLGNLSEFVERHYRSLSGVYMELVGPMPKQGVASTYQFGRGVGQLEGLLAGYSLAVTYIAPARWRSLARVRQGKDGSRLKARELFPESKALFSNKGHHGRAEAALIAWVGSERLGVVK